MPDSTLEEIFKYYYLVYTAYVNEGYLATFVKSEKLIRVWVRLDNGLWRPASGVMMFDDFHEMTYCEMCEEASKAIHRSRKPWD